MNLAALGYQKRPRVFFFLLLEHLALGKESVPGRMDSIFGSLGTIRNSKQFRLRTLNAPSTMYLLDDTDYFNSYKPAPS